MIKFSNNLRLLTNTFGGTGVRVLRTTTEYVTNTNQFNAEGVSTTTEVFNGVRYIEESKQYTGVFEDRDKTSEYGFKEGKIYKLHFYNEDQVKLYDIIEFNDGCEKNGKVFDPSLPIAKIRIEKRTQGASDHVTFVGALIQSHALAE